MEKTNPNYTTDCALLVHYFPPDNTLTAIATFLRLLKIDLFCVLIRICHKINFIASRFNALKNLPTF